MSLARLLARQDGVVSRRQALAFITARVLERHVTAGRWQRVHHGVYVTHNGPLTESQRLWAASLGAGGGHPAVVGGLSALTLAGLRNFTSDAIHLLLPARRRDTDVPEGVRIHRTTRLSPTELLNVSPPRTVAPRSVIDAAQWARTDKEARTIIAISFQQGLVVGDQVEEGLARMGIVKRRRLIIATARDSATGSHTISELDFLRLCRDNRLPIPDRQAVRVDATGRRRYLDIYFYQWRIRVEIDGSHHMWADQWWDDMRRHNDLSLGGELVLRFPAWVVRDHPEQVAATLRRALLAAGWLPGVDLGR